MRVALIQGNSKDIQMFKERIAELNDTKRHLFGIWGCTGSKKSIAGLDGFDRITLNMLNDTIRLNERLLGV